MVFVMICFAIIVFCIYMAIKLSKERKKEREKIQQAFKENNANFCIELPHLIGLPILENVKVMIYECVDKYEFRANGLAIDLSKEKLKDVSIKTVTEIQKQCVSSIGGAIAGGALFGTLGAIIGGRAKTKSVKNISSCLIFTYMDKEDIKYIAFDATEGFFDANKLVKLFKQNCNKETTKITL